MALIYLELELVLIYLGFVPLGGQSDLEDLLAKLLALEVNYSVVARSLGDLGWVKPIVCRGVSLRCLSGS